MHFLLTGDPNIDAEAWGPKQRGPIVTLDLGKPNQVAPVARVAPVVVKPNPRALYLDDNGKAPAARPISVTALS